MKYVGITALVIIGLMVLSGIGVAVGIVTLPWQNVQNKVQLNQDAIDATVNYKNCAQWYDWFKTQEASIETMQTTVQTNQDNLDTFKKTFPDSSKWTDSQSQQYTDLNTNLTGSKIGANEAINDYNAKAQQENLAYCKNGLKLFFHPF